ncbi:uncharacterized protein Aud_005533 [Aspergillus udagawae]|uniref:Uncharacterized protein n=1 Tax=Aspergillus udagawae TaxID=91492 RepID=A0A8E0QRI7_9EURO|nr:uncharacterized protein Aud_005533 [Aspergillus udagawae]GIC89130.1 hypothetical protein Aud_005533 [Aspergillus udagawae]
MVLRVVNIIIMSAMIPTRVIPGIVGLTEDDKHNRRDDHSLKREDEKRRQAADREQPSNLQVITKFQEGSVKERLQLEDAKVYAHPKETTSELRYGSWEDSEGQICGPWDATQDEQEYVTLQDNQWLAVQLPNSEEQQAWQPYYNGKDSSAALPAGARFMEVHLKRLPVS